MLSFAAGAFALGMAVQTDTVVTLGTIERDLTGDGRPEVLRLIGAGLSVDSLDVTFLIESAGDILFRTALAPLTRIVGFDAGRRELSTDGHRARLDDFGGWFFSNASFMGPDEFVEMLRSSARQHVSRVPETIARDRMRQSMVDSLTNAGHTQEEAERDARWPSGVPLDTARAAGIWQEILSTGVTVFTYSPGGDSVTAIAWSSRDRRFCRLFECC